MSYEHDLVIRDGTIVDGSGGAPYRGDVAINGERISNVGAVSGRAQHEIDANGLLVTPGFVDIHTHYDGQAIWSSRLNPSSQHGVTTVLIGNCGVGFAPCRKQDHDLIVRVMEGVEDIPGIVMTEGLEWDWETFPQFLDAIAKRPHDIDVAAYLPHSPLRVYAMGERGATRQRATAVDLEKMSALAREAATAGALGFSSSRATVHRSADGKHIPSYDASLEELVTIGRAMKEAGAGLMQIAPELPDEPSSALMEKLIIDAAREADIPLTLTLGIRNSGPVRWTAVARLMEDAKARGATVFAQVLPRPIGAILGLQHTLHPFSVMPSYEPLAKLPLAARVKAMRDPAMRSRLLGENPVSDHPLRLMARDFGWIFPLGSIPDYEPRRSDSVAARATELGVKPEELMYDLLLENDGRRSFLMALGNLHNYSLDETARMLEHPQTVIGLGDGGAHYGMICDGSYPTFMLMHWTRDREGKKFPLEQVVQKLSAETARAIGLNDRGLLARGYKADVNIIDYNGLQLHAPQVVADLPGGGERLDQKASGYVATIVSGQVISRNGTPLNSLPGKLVRGRQPQPVTRG